MDSEKEPTVSPAEQAAENRAELFRQSRDITFGTFEDEDYGFEIPLTCDARAIEKDQASLERAIQALSDARLYLVLSYSDRQQVWDMLRSDAEKRLQAIQAEADQLGLGDASYAIPEPIWPAESDIPADDEWEAQAQGRLQQTDFQWPGDKAGNLAALVRVGERPWALPQLADLLCEATEAVGSKE